MTDPVSPRDDDDLPALRAPPTGRRTDDAFARAVAADVNARRGRFKAVWLGVPALAGAAAVVVAVASPGADRDVGRAVYASLAASADNDEDADLAAFDDDVIALADVDDDDDDAGFGFGGASDFAIPGLAGSSDGELEDIEAALDRALKL